MIQPQRLCRGRESSFMNERREVRGGRGWGSGAWCVHRGLVPVPLSPPFGEAMKIWLKRFLSVAAAAAAANADASSSSLLPPSWVGLKVARRQTERLQSFAPLRPPAVKSVRSRKEARRGEGKRAGSIKHIWVRCARLTTRLRSEGGARYHHRDVAQGSFRVWIVFLSYLKWKKKQL